MSHKFQLPAYLVVIPCGAAKFVGKNDVKIQIQGKAHWLSVIKNNADMCMTLMVRGQSYLNTGRFSCFEELNDYVYRK